MSWTEVEFAEGFRRCELDEPFIMNIDTPKAQKPQIR